MIDERPEFEPAQKPPADSDPQSALAIADLADAEVASSSAESPTFVVGIGASAGGLEPLEKFFDKMPATKDIAFVVVQHLSPSYKSLMDELLARHTEMPIHRVENGMSMEGGAIYLIPPKQNMVVSGGKLLLTEQDSDGGLNLPIDIFFRSLAQNLGSQAICVVLSGTGSDGSRGVKAVHEAGGLVMVQTPESSQFDGMPQSALATGFADRVLLPQEMPDAIITYVQNPVRGQVRPEDRRSITVEASPLNEVFQLLQTNCGIDFADYKPTTIGRRIERRMSFGNFSDVNDYLRRLHHDPRELDLLYQDLLIGVTDFFRDPGAYIKLENEVVPKIVQRAEPGNDIRVWVPGCASGEEAYSLAMLFHEAIASDGRDLSIKIFASDVHKPSLEAASQGVYPESAVSGVRPDRLEEFFIKHEDRYEVRRELRQMVVFAPHNVIKDPPFTKLDLVSCRNMLIYFQPSVQQKVVSLFHFALKAGGVMFLGPSESVGELGDEFDAVDDHWKIYRKTRDVRLPAPFRAVAAHRALDQQANAAIQAGRHTSRQQQHLLRIYDELLEAFIPPSILLNERREVQHVFGEAGRFLTHRFGRFETDILTLVDDRLKGAIGAAIHRATNDNSAVTYKGIRLEIDGEEADFQIAVKPFVDKVSGAHWTLLTVDDSGPRNVEASAVMTAVEFDGDTAKQIADLQAELQYTKESLQTTNEELVSANEELQSTNEELVASNEELQSTNEELHSVNEELHTVNAEHQRKIAELTQLTNDMDNLLRSTEIGTVFLDRDLRIRRFTAAISQTINLLPRDEGRPIDHISYNIDIAQDDLLKICRDVLQKARAREREVQTRAGTWTLMRVTPYRTQLDRVEGVVLTFFDTSLLKQAEAELKDYASRLEDANRDLQDFAYMASHDLQAPLRTIARFSELLLQHDRAGLSQKGSDRLQRVARAAQRMQTLINDLLEYSRVETRGKDFVETNISNIVEAAQENLATRIAEAAATIHVDELPELPCDDTQLTNLFQNLIDNALKFQGNNTPEIWISADHQHDEWVFSVRDNGIGFPPEQSSRIFVIFKRLHSSDEYPGTGMGLAISKRIVERHGGRIWVSSKPGAGSTFFFSLPN